MNYSDKYTQRLNNKGINANESLINKSKYLFNEKFETSPSYSIIKINGIESDALVSNATKHNEKTIGFRPDSTVEIGSLIEYKNNFYLIDSIFENEIAATGSMKLCNSTYPIKANKTKTLKLDAQGNPIIDKFGDPVYTYTDGQITYLPCIAESTFTGSDENTKLPLPQGQLRITMQYQNVDEIKVNNTFTMYNNVYKIRNMDYTKVMNNKGIVALSVEQVQSEVK